MLLLLHMCACCSFTQDHLLCLLMGDPLLGEEVELVRSEAGSSAENLEVAGLPGWGAGWQRVIWGKEGPAQLQEGRVRGCAGKRSALEPSASEHEDIFQVSGEGGVNLDLESEALEVDFGQPAGLCLPVLGLWSSGLGLGTRLAPGLAGEAESRASEIGWA